MDYRNDHPLLQAQWIKVPKSLWQQEKVLPHQGIRSACFQTTFTLAQKPAKLLVSLSAASRYRLWLNGQPLASGPCKGDAYRRYYDSLDLSRAAQPGINVLSIQVVAFSAPENSDPEKISPIWSHPSLAGPLLIVHSDFADSLTTGRGNWRVACHLGLDWQSFPDNKWAGAMEVFTAARRPSGWPLAMPEAVTVPAAPAGGPDYNPYGELGEGPLMPRPIPLLFEKPGQFSSKVPDISTKPPSFSFDLDAGMLRTAFLRLHLRGGRGARLRLIYSESYWTRDENGKLSKGRRDDATGTLRGAEDVIYCDGSDFTYEPFLFRTFRFIRVIVESNQEPLTGLCASYIETGYPLQAKSTLQSSASWIEPVWRLSHHTLQCCMHDTYEDCPYYEQLQYILDTRLQMLFTYRFSGDVRLARRTLEDFHASRLPEGMLQSRYPSQVRQIIPGFSLHWLFMLEDYFWQTADLSLIRRYLGTADSLIAWFERKTGSQGLVTDLGYWDFLDWTREWDKRHGVPDAVAKGPVTVSNLVLITALQSLAFLHDAAGHADQARQLREWAADLRKLVYRLCYCEKEGLFQDGPGLKQYSQHAQVWAVLAEVVDPKQSASILKQALCRNDLVLCSFPQQFFLFRALEKAGLYAQTEKLWSLWQDLLPLGLTTIPEVPFDPRSDCHAWGSLLLYEGPAKILGVEPAAPGWKKIRIRPQATFLSDAAGIAITPHGPVEVQLSRDDSDKITLRGKSPVGIPLEILFTSGETFHFPQGGNFHVSQN